MTKTIPSWTNDNEYKEFDGKLGLQEVANACIGYVVADLLALVQRDATSGLRLGGRLRGLRSLQPWDNCGGPEVGHGIHWRVVPVQHVALGAPRHQVG